MVISHHVRRIYHPEKGALPPLDPKESSMPSKFAAHKLVAERQRIEIRLDALGITMASIDEEYNLSGGAARNAMREPNAGAERAIAAKLNTHPHLLWPSRYRPNGERLKPQDWTRVPTMQQRRKEAGGLT
jgi:Ner family transcriptional regulator